MQKIILVLKKVDNFLSKVAKIITAAAICIQMVIVFLGVVFRYFLKSPLLWSDELACYLLVFVTFFGSYVALKEKALANIELITSKLPGMIRRIVMLVSNITVIILLGAVLYFGVVLSMSPVVLKAVSPAMELPTVIFYAILPLAAFMMIVHMLVAIYEDFRSTNDDSKQGEEYTCL